jgi:hypothetical protein
MPTADQIAAREAGLVAGDLECMINSYHGSVTETEIIEYVSGLPEL